MSMTEAIPAELGFMGGQSLVLFHHPLPKRAVESLPLAEIQVEPLDDSGGSDRKESETFSYDRNGRMDCEEKKGLLIDSYF
jgi:hypothetical protein